MITPAYLIGDVLPDPSLDHSLRDCPRCGATYCINGVRRGPAVLYYSSNQYRVFCLACWLRSRSGRTPEKAVHHWNANSKPSQLKRLREEAGLSQEQLADLAGKGIGAGSISKFERGAQVPSEKIKQQLAAVLRCSAKEI